MIGMAPASNVGGGSTSQTNAVGGGGTGAGVGAGAGVGVGEGDGGGPPAGGAPPPEPPQATRPLPAPTIATANNRALRFISTCRHADGRCAHRVKWKVKIGHRPSGTGCRR